MHLDQWLVPGTWAVSLIWFISGVWGMRGHFVFDAGMPAGMMAVTALSLLGWAWFLVRIITSGLGPGAPLALALMAGSVGLFWWAVKATRERRLKGAFVRDEPQFLCETGPYRFVRHPFYLSYILCWIGTSLATKGVASWVVPFCMGAIYTGLALEEERGFRASGLSDAFDEYCSDTGRFIPRLHFGRRRELSRHA